MVRGGWVVLVAALLSAPIVRAQREGFGLGIMLGEPTGLSAKVWTQDRNALAFGLAWGGWGHGGYVHLHADHLFHNFNVISVSKGSLPLYYGPGLRLRSWTGHRYWHRGHYHDGQRLDLGVRFPVGLNYHFANDPLDIFLEVVPTLDLVPSTDFELDLALGARYWFR